MKALVACVGLLALGVQARGAEYARPELLIEPEELLKILAEGSDPADLGISLVDVRPRKVAIAGVIRGASLVSPAEWTSAFMEERDIRDWTARIGHALYGGFGSTVVVYDEGVTPNAARIWWILKYWGVEDVRVLNGGVQSYLRVGGKLEKPVYMDIFYGLWRAKPDTDRLATRDEVSTFAINDAPGACLVDTRSDAEVARGVIPDARHADWVRFVDPATGKMRSADELSALLDEVGFDPDERAIAYCRSGGRASVVAFAMELMGGRRVANYFGSWNDWTSDPTAPIAELGGRTE